MICSVLPAAYHHQVEAHAPHEVVFVVNRLGEVMAQYVLPAVTEQDRALRARGIDPRGPVKFVGEPQGAARG